MTDDGEPAGQPAITASEWIRALVVVLAVVAVTAAIVGWFVASFVLKCGCTTPA